MIRDLKSSILGPYNLNNPEIGQRYRQTILSQGSQKKAAELVKDFLGRAPDNKAFLDEITGQRVK